MLCFGAKLFRPLARTHHDGVRSSTHSKHDIYLASRNIISLLFWSHASKEAQSTVIPHLRVFVPL